MTNSRPCVQKILFIADREMPGGAPNALLRLLERIDKNRFQPVVLLPRGSSLVPMLAATGSEIVERKMVRWRKVKYWPRLPFFMSRIAMLARRREVAMIVALDLCEAPLAVCSARLARIPAICWFHDPLVSQEKIRKYLVPKADGVVAVSAHLARKIESLNPRGTVTVIHNGIDPAQFGPERYNEDFRQRLGIDEGELTLAMLGTLSERKGQLELIRALAILSQRGIAPRVILAGRNDNDYGRALREQVKQNGLEKQVFILGYHDPAGEALAAADIFVFLSTVEGLPLALMEAMGMGMPCIYCRAPAMNELMEVVVPSGLAVERESPEKIADAIEQLAADKTLQNTLGQNARRAIKERFTVDLQAKRFEEFFERVIARRTKARG